MCTDCQWIFDILYLEHILQQHPNAYLFARSIIVGKHDTQRIEDLDPALKLQALKFVGPPASAATAHPQNLTSVIWRISSSSRTFNHFSELIRFNLLTLGRLTIPVVLPVGFCTT